MSYNVIIVLDESRERSYYHSYNEVSGNIQCEDLPPYADVLKARACYREDDKWIFDEEKYQELVEEHDAHIAEAKQAAMEASAVPSNTELAIGLMEVCENLDALFEAVSELGLKVAELEGGE